MRASPLPVQLRLCPLPQRRSRDYRSAGSVWEEDHRAGMLRKRRSNRPSQEGIAQGASHGATPSTPSTPPPSAVVRELREPGDATMHGVRIEYMWTRVCRGAVEAAPTRVPTAAGGGVWGGVCEGG